MSYARQVWADNDPTKPASAARMNYIEAGIQDASDRLDLLVSGPEGIVPVVEDVRLGGPYLSAPLSVLRAGIANAATSTRVVTLGSSTIGGGGASHDSIGFVSRLAYRSGASGVQSLTASDNSGTGVQWYQGAIGGATAATYCPSGHLSRISALQPKVVIHMVGSNDAATGVTPTDYRDAVHARVVAIEAAVPGVVQVLVHAHERIDTTLAAPWEQYRDALAWVVQQAPARRRLVDLMRYVGVRGTAQGNRWGLVGPDGIHLVDKAHKLYADIFSVLLNLPTENDEPEVIYAVPLPASGTVYSATTTLGTVAIPAAPYPREVRMEGHLTVQVTTAANELQVGVNGAEGGDVANLPQPANWGSNRSVAIAESFFLPPLTVGAAFVRVVPTADFRVSGAGAYSRVSVLVRGV